MLINGPHKVCTGESITLSVDAGYASYEWLPDHQTGYQITVSPIVSTTYSVTASNPGEVAITFPAHLVTVYQTYVPVLEYLAEVHDGVEIWVDFDAAVVSADGYVLLRTKEAYSSYVWYKDGAVILGGVFRYYQAIGDGNYKVVAKSYNGCYGESVENSVTLAIGDSCFMRLLQPTQDSVNVPVNTELVFDVRFNYAIPPLSTINVSITDGGSPLLGISGVSSVPGVVIYSPSDPGGTDGGYRYVISGLRCRSGSPVQISVVVK